MGDTYLRLPKFKFFSPSLHYLIIVCIKILVCIIIFLHIIILGLCELEKSVGNSVSLIKIKAPEPKRTVTETGYIKKAGKLEAVLAQVHQV